MSFILYNPNPEGDFVGDCVVRAISKLMDREWDDTYISLVVMGYTLKDMPSANRVWGAFLHGQGYNRYIIPNTCPDCYSVAQFCDDHPTGKYLLATGSHVICVQYGDYFDSWDSGDETPIFYWTKEGEMQ